MDIGPCESWPAVWCCDLTGATPAITGIALRAATEVLWGLSGRQFGECVIEDLRPCRDECETFSSLAPNQWGGWPSPALISGQWYNLGCGGACDAGCSCNTVEQFTLPTIASRIVDIVIDGEIMPTGSYRLDNLRYVVRTDGGQWPWCNNLSITHGPGAWSVTIAVGAEVPSIGQLAVGALACEIVKLCREQECALPTNARRVTRQGVTVDTPEITARLESGAMGIEYVDMFVATFNPNRLQGRSKSYSPDVPRMRYPT